MIVLLLFINFDMNSSEAEAERVLCIHAWIRRRCIFARLASHCGVELLIFIIWNLILGFSKSWLWSVSCHSLLWSMIYLIWWFASLLDLEIVILEISTSIIINIVVYHASVVDTWAAWMLLCATSSSKLCLLQILLLFKAIQITSTFRIL